MGANFGVPEKATDILLKTRVKQVLEFTSSLLDEGIPGVKDIDKQSLCQSVPPHHPSALRTPPIGLADLPIGAGDIVSLE